MFSLFDAGSDTSDSEDVDYVPSTTDADHLSEASDTELVSSENERENLEERGDEKKEERERVNIKSLKKRKVRNKKCLEKEISCEESKNSSTCGVTNDSKNEKPNDVWKRFLEEVNEKTKEEEVGDGEKEKKIGDPSSEGLSDVSEAKEDSRTENVEIEDKGEKKTATTTMFEFAGELLAVKEKDNKILSNGENTLSNSNTSRVQTTSSDSLKQGVKRKRGLDSVLETVKMNKKHKLTILEKSNLDWLSYKADEGIDDELVRYNKGKGGFLERQRFLQRSDLRSFQIEKATRLSKMKKH